MKVYETHFNQTELKLLRRNCSQCTFWSSILSARAVLTWQSSPALPALGEMWRLPTAASQHFPRTHGKNGSVFTSLSHWTAVLLCRKAPGCRMTQLKFGLIQEYGAFTAFVVSLRASSFHFESKKKHQLGAGCLIQNCTA